MLAPSDFSALKNFVRKPVLENRSKFFQWFKITSNQLTVNDVICDVVFVNNNTAILCYGNEFWLPSGYIFQQDGAPAHTARATQNYFTSNCKLTSKLPRFHCQRTVASKFNRLEPLGLPYMGGNVGGLSQTPSETENDRRTGGSPSGDLGQPTSGTNRQSCQRVLKATEGLCCSWGWTFRTITVTAMLWLRYFCLNDVILLRDCLDIFERAKIGRWQCQ